MSTPIVAHGTAKTNHVPPRAAGDQDPSGTGHAASRGGTRSGRPEGDQPSPRPAPRTTDLTRGSFTDGVRTFTVRASGPVAPDSFQVYANGNPAEVVLVISGIGSGELRATWGAQWRTASETWRDWCEASAFMVFYNGRGPAPGSVRACNG
ncbi:hypothetical protein GCM10029992_59650 [Glycomyces albus]